MLRNDARDKIKAELQMHRIFGLAWAATLTATPAISEPVSYLFCEYGRIGAEQRLKSQSIPLYYELDDLSALGKDSYCAGEREFFINDTHATWRCITAYNADQTAAKSVYVEINRFTGRYHRNDFTGHYNAPTPIIDEIWHGVCTAHHEAQF